MSSSRLLKILLLVSCFSFLVSSLSFLASPALAGNIFLQKQAAIRDSTGLESWTDEAVGNNLTSTFIGLNGTVPEEVINDLTSTGTIKPITFIPSGAIGQANTYIGYLNIPPASGIEYLAQIKDEFLGKPAYAQGAGFQGLQFLLPLWRGFRNVVYVIASIIFIAIGLMIMLRIKISPQAVVTVQSAIPQLITTLVLVTFSYAIAGLVIDLANFIQGLIIALLFSINGTGLNQQLFEQSWTGNFFVTLHDFFTSPNYTFSSLLKMDHDTFQSLAQRLQPRFITSVMLGAIAGKTILGLAGGILGTVAGLILPVILSILVFFWLIKLFFGLLKNYGIVIFKIILSPLEIGMGAMPNSKMGFSSWFMDLVSHILVFPIISIFVVLANFIIDAIAGVKAGPIPWTPNLIYFGDIAGKTGSAQIVIAAAFGIVCLSIIAKLPDMIPEFIFNLKPSPWGKAIGEGLGEIGKPTKFGGQMALEKSTQYAQERGHEDNANPFWKIGAIAGDAAETMGFVKGSKKKS